MAILLDFLYLFCLLAAIPWLVYKSWQTGKYRSDWGQRLGRISEANMAILKDHRQAKRIMLHCVSVGELLSIRLLVEELLKATPELFIIITTTTDTGSTRAIAAYNTGRYMGRVMCLRYPLDFSFAIRQFLDAVAPDLVVLVELETWPNFIGGAARRGIPVCVVNGRLTQRSYRRYRLFRPIIARMFSQIESFGVQTQIIAERFKALGASADRIHVLPTIKYDTAEITDEVAGARALAQAMGIPDECSLFVAGSIGPGECEPLIAVYLVLRPKFPGLRLAIAPRKPDTLPGVLAALEKARLEPLLRTNHPDGTPGVPLLTNQVIVLDTLGELKKLYSLAIGVFSGRSLIPLGGSDMIEVAALAKPACFGPYTYNFADAVELLSAGNGAVEINNSTELQHVVETWLSHPADARAMGLRARECIMTQRGSSLRYAREIIDLSVNRPEQQVD